MVLPISPSKTIVSEGRIVLGKVIIFGMRLKMLLYLAILAILISALNIFALRFHLYWLLPWFDNMMHVFGGVLISALIFIVFNWSNFNLEKYPINFKYFATVNILSVFIVGLLWEIFELVFGITYTVSSDYVRDTISDLSLDVIGAILFIFFARNKIIGRIQE